MPKGHFYIPKSIDDLSTIDIQLLFRSTLKECAPIAKEASEWFRHVIQQQQQIFLIQGYQEDDGWHIYIALGKYVAHEDHNDVRTCEMISGEENQRFRLLANAYLA